MKMALLFLYTYFIEQLHPICVLNADKIGLR